MSTAITPETPTTPAEESVTTPPTTPPENNPPAPPVNTNTDEIARLREAYNGALREANIRAEQAAAEAERLRNQFNNNQPSSTPEQDVELLTSNPRELIRQEFQAAIRPLQQQAAQFSRASMLQEIKASALRDPRFEYLKNQQISDIFDQMLASVPEPNMQIVPFLYSSAIGTFVQQGGILNPQTSPATPTPNTHSQTVPTPPPTPRPSAPTNLPQNNNQQRPRREYTENERLIMRLNNLSPEQYDAEMGLAPSQVVVGPQNNG